MADEIRTDTPGLARRLGQFDIEDVYIHLVCDPRLRFYIPKRWWTYERFDVNVHADAPLVFAPGLVAPHLEVDVGSHRVSIYRPTHRIDLASLALLNECLQFASAVLTEA